MDEGTTDPFVLRADDGAVRTLTLNRPAQRNALSLAMLTALGDELDAADGDPSVHVVVLAGAGPAFSAGHDLRELAAADHAHATRVFAACAEVMLRIESLRQPAVASVAGIATAAGCQLVATCDLAVAGRSARFATPGVDIGLFCSTPMVAVTRAVAPKHAMELLLTGEMVDAETALRMGLVNRVVDDEALDAAVSAVAEQVASKPPAVVAAGKATYRRQVGLGSRAAYEVASQAMVDGLAGPDAAEGIAAFLEKRPPRWTP